MKKALILVVLLFTVFLGEILIYDKSSTSQEGPFIAITSYPLYEITNILIGEKLNVVKLIPFGVEAHSYMPSVKTMSSILKADLFIYNGLGLEPWVKKHYDNSINMSNYVTLNENFSGHEHAHHQNGIDPHYWLDINNMIKMTKIIQNRLIKDFPEFKETLNKNAQTYIKELKTLDKSFSSALSECKNREIVVNHNAFGYLGSRYNFEVHALTGLSPDEQVSAKSLKEMTDLVREEHINTIFFESFVSDKLALSISKETGAKVRSLQPLANVTKEEAEKGYILIMKTNLKKLVIAMECE